MWCILSTLARRSLARHLLLQALELNQRGLRLLDVPDTGNCVDADAGRSSELREVAVASDACWRVMRGSLKRRQAEPDWRSVRDNLQRVARLFGAPPLDHRSLQRLLRTQSRWLGELVAVTPPSGSELQREIVRVYRRARQALRDDPAGSRGERRLGRLLTLVELLQSQTGPIEGGGLTALAEGGARLQRLQCTQKRQRRRRQRRETLRAMHREAADSFAQRPREFARSLPWELFRALAEQPGPRHDVSFGDHG